MSWAERINIFWNEGPADQLCYCCKFRGKIYTIHRNFGIAYFAKITSISQKGAPNFNWFSMLSIHPSRIRIPLDISRSSFRFHNHPPVHRWHGLPCIWCIRSYRNHRRLAVCTFVCRNQTGYIRTIFLRRLSTKMLLYAAWLQTNPHRWKKGTCSDHSLVDFRGRLHNGA